MADENLGIQKINSEIMERLIDVEMYTLRCRFFFWEIIVIL